MIAFNMHLCTFVFVDGSGCLTAVHVKKLQDALLVFGDTRRHKYLEITVRSEDLDVTGLLQPLEEAMRVALDSELGRHLEILSQYFGKSNSFHCPLSGLYKQGLIAAESLEQYFPTKIYIFRTMG